MLTIIFKVLIGLITFSSFVVSHADNVTSINQIKWSLSSIFWLLILIFA